MLRTSVGLGRVVLAIAAVLCAAECPMYASTASVSPPAQQGEIAGVVVATRANGEGNRSLLLKTSTSLSGQVVDEIHVKLPKDAAKEAAPGLLPPEWIFTLDGRDLKLSGPPLQDQENIFIRVDVEVTNAPRELEVQLFSQGRKLFNERLPVSQLPPVQVIDSLEDLMVVPRQVSPGERIEVEALDPQQTPADGSWTIAGMVTERVEPPLAGEPPKNPRFSVNLPESLSPGDRIEVVYTDPWGEPIVEVPTVDDVEVVRRPAGIPALTPRLTACTPKAFADSIVCVCGWFPTETAWNSLTINGKPFGAPVSAASGVVHVRLPSELPPGPYVIAGDPSGGFSPEDNAQVVVLGVGGEIDQNKLLRGEDTHLRLWVQGTEEILGLRLRNTTPGIVSFEGGEDQVVYTSGGPENNLEKVVHAVSPGAFNITYTLEADPCPCAGVPLQLASGVGLHLTGSLPYSDRELAERRQVIRQQIDAVFQEGAKLGIDEEELLQVMEEASEDTVVSQLDDGSLVEVGTGVPLKTGGGTTTTTSKPCCTQQQIAAGLVKIKAAYTAGVARVNKWKGCQDWSVKVQEAVTPTVPPCWVGKFVWRIKVWPFGRWTPFDEGDSFIHHAYAVCPCTCATFGGCAECIVLDPYTITGFAMFQSAATYPFTDWVNKGDVWRATTIAGHDNCAIYRYTLQYYCQRARKGGVQRGTCRAVRKLLMRELARFTDATGKTLQGVYRTCGMIPDCC